MLNVLLKLTNLPKIVMNRYGILRLCARLSEMKEVCGFRFAVQNLS